MPWNLIDALSEPGQRRRFSLPLASIPPDRTTVRTVEVKQFTVTETYTSQVINGRPTTTDVVLEIDITGGLGPLGTWGHFLKEDSLPDPAARLHAMDAGILRFRPKGGGWEDSLVLETITFQQPLHEPGWGEVKWWERWIEAGCIPRRIIYENVKRDALETLVNGLPTPIKEPPLPAVPGSLPSHEEEAFRNSYRPTPPKRVFGVQVPFGVYQENRDTFIKDFFNGKSFLAVESGAFIGEANFIPLTAPNDPEVSPRRLRLHVQYHDHKDTDPHPMNPRELFALLFGDDSVEAQNHPLLQYLESKGQSGQTTTHPKTKRMLLRPPLRTSKRVEWEANIEVNNHAANWAPAGTLGNNRFYNDHSRNALDFDDAGYTNSDKCNLFVSDICLRAGFRVGIHPTANPATWHYLDANSYTNQVQQGAGADDRVALRGNAQRGPVTWAWKIENWLRAEAPADRQRLLNEAITEEGRCLIWAGARGRRFRTYQINTQAGAVQGIANCDQALRRIPSGHIVIVREVTAQPAFAAAVGDGLQDIDMSTLQASGAGAVQVAYNPVLGGQAAGAAAANGFVRHHVFELHPGKDPDTLQGLGDLNVQLANVFLLGTANERAPDRQRTHTPAGNPAPPNQCCRDQYPPQNAPTTIVNC